MTGMRLEGVTEIVVSKKACLDGSSFVDVSLAQSKFTDVNPAGARFENVNMSGVTIDDVNLSGMTIQGVLVTDLLEAYEKLKG